MTSTHLVFYIQRPSENGQEEEEDRLIIWRDFRSNFEAEKVLYFVFAGSQLRESPECLDDQLDWGHYYFAKFQCCRMRWPSTQPLDSLIAQLCSLPEPSENCSNFFELSLKAEQLYQTWQTNVLVLSFKGLKGKVPSPRIQWTKLTLPKKSIFHTVAVIAARSQLSSMQALNLTNFEFVVVHFALNKYCLLNSTHRQHVLQLFASQLPNEDVTRDKVETLEVGAGGPNLFSQTLEEELNSKNAFRSKRELKNKFNKIKHYCTCEICAQSDEFNPNMDKNGPEKLLTHKLSLEQLIQILGAGSLATDRLLDQLSALSVAAFDIESMTVGLSHTMPDHILPYADIDSASKAQHLLALQKPIMLAHRDALMAPEEPCRVFVLEEDSESGIYSLLRSYWKFVTERQQMCERKKWQLAQPLFELVHSYSQAHFGFMQEWLDPTVPPEEARKNKFEMEDMMDAFKCSLPGRLLGLLKTLIWRYKIFSFYGSGYDHVLLENYLVPYLFEKKLKPKLEKRGNKVTAIRVEKCHVAFRDVTKLLAPGTSLRQFGQLFNLPQAKAHFPFALLSGLQSLTIAELPPTVQGWQSDLNVTKADLTQAEVNEARALFEQAGCQNLGDYLQTYLRLDVDILYAATQGWRQTMRQEVGLDFIQTGNFTISSISNLASNRCAARHLQVGQFFPNSSAVYRLLRKGMRG